MRERALTGLRRRARASVLLLASLSIVVAALACFRLGTLDRVEAMSLDARFALRGSAPPPHEVVVVGLDERSLAALGPMWPLPRATYARLIDRLHDAGARVIVLDVQFTGIRSAGDLTLLEAARRAGNVVFTTATTDRAGHTDVLGGTEVIADLGAQIANANLPTDVDGAVRRLPFAVNNLRSIAVVAGAAARRRAVTLEDFPSSTSLIDFAGPPQTVDTISLQDALRRDVPERLVRDRVAVVGATAPVLQDRHVTSADAGELMSGPEIQANAIATVLRSFPLRDVPRWASELLIVVLGILPSLCAIAFARRWLWIAITATGGCVLLIASVIAFSAGHVLALIVPLLALSAAAAATLSTDYAFLAAERRRLRRLFAQHAPLVVEDVLAGGEAARASGVTPSSIIPGYRFEAVLGKGGMGVVYLARQLSLDRQVAIKLLRPDIAQSPELRARFVREARLAAAIEHPHVTPVYAAEESDGLLFVAMRYVDGPTLEDVLRHCGALAPERVVRIVSQVASALDAAHANGLVHRDVKPANVLLAEAPAEHAYLSDFGLARLVDDDCSMTRPGELLGTVDYMSPEQVTGAPVTARADVYALAAMLFRMLTGEVPYPGCTEVETLFAHVSAPVPRPSERNAACVDVDEVLVQAMSKDPAQRHASAGALARAFEAAARHSSTPADGAQQHQQPQTRPKDEGRAADTRSLSPDASYKAPKG